MGNVHMCRISVIWSWTCVSEKNYISLSSWNREQWPFSANASPMLPMSLPSPLIHFYFPVASKPKGSVTFSWPGHFGCWILGSLCGLWVVPALRSRARLAGVPPGDLRSHLGPDLRLPAQPSRTGSQLWVCRCFTRTLLLWFGPSVGNLSLFWS